MTAEHGKNINYINAEQHVFPEGKPHTLSSWRASIITSILKNGLQTSQYMDSQRQSFLGSGDSNPNDCVFGRILNRADLQHQNGKDGISDALYSGENSVLPVITERPTYFSYYNFLRNQELEDRIKASLVVVTKLTGKPEQLDPVATLKGLPSNEFTHLLFPEQILREYLQVVGNFSLTNPKTSVVPIRESLGALIFERPVISAVPNYESVVRRILQESDSTIWIHGVRLPTNTDAHVALLPPEQRIAE